MDENYRPVHIEFDVAHDGSNMPLTLGEFATADEAAKFMGGSFTSINQSLTVSRFLDQKEKSDIRKVVNDLLENKLPVYERDLSTATAQFNEAKKKVNTCQEMVNATITEARSLAFEVKRGLKDMRLDDIHTSRVPYRGRYYFYTYMDKELKLCAIKDIPEHEKSEIWNAMAKNEEIVDSNFNANEPASAQERTEE